MRNLFAGASCDIQFVLSLDFFVSRYCTIIYFIYTFYVILIYVYILIFHNTDKRNEEYHFLLLISESETQWQRKLAVVRFIDPVLFWEYQSQLLFSIYYVTG